ncbi:hypothetical protein A1Q1_01600 [Trichosporon asahii var. asahii CBS 2479]|uniref:U4/U6 snRNA-associated-splicing factor PRP24 n=1 Tax=Trichosporon asahii var. asahii (strain ATCC 90039 / CBS 2479 / JCM 2466 / KCTC 7840 / NBRC 103889/ NCYC 2677 / UAMH 7654) TaxID=1186058 RepID=J4UDQ5_TRIAS|nr:hypothetical protein A1Q1_01600 [Trichosporon asahii var. asahii CBS 2479]EJT49300.1 hypothetical protein A1Q1_01600 [Trichosporon asahii var. asahii CBS 2479]
MDVDKTIEALPANQDELVAELGELLEQVAEQPSNLRLLRRQVELMLQLDMVDEAVDAAEALHAKAFVGEASSPRPFTLDSFADIIDMFAKAETEYSLQILERHVRFITALAGLPSEEDVSKDDELNEFLSPETVRETLRGLTKRTNGLLSDSQRVWQPWIDWELALLEQAPAADKWVKTGGSRLTFRAEQMERVHHVYLERLRVPHSKPADLQAYATDIGQQAAILLSYIDWETDPLATRKPKGKKGPQQDHELTSAVFERTVLLYSNAANASEDASWAEDVAEQMKQAAEAYRSAEATVWARYVDWVAANPPADVDEDENEELVREVAGRSTRACPTDGGLWARYILNLEEAREITRIEQAVEKAQDIIIANSAPVSALVEVQYNHLAILHRRYRDLEVNLFAKTSEAIELMTTAYPSGDPSLKLEKFFVAWAEAIGAELLPGVMMVIEKPIHSRTLSYQYTIMCADAQARIGETDAARKLYTQAIGRKDLDWPEAVYDAFTLFENTHGSLETLREAKKAIGHEQQKLNRRRQKAAEAQAQVEQQYQQQAAAAAAAAESAAAPVAAPDGEPAAEGTADVTMAEVEAAPVTAPEASAAPAQEPKKDEEEPQLKRDREHTTVLVTGLRKGTEADRVTKFFANSGLVRECTMVPGEETDSALVEFQTADAVPDALDKDRKKLDSSEIRVAMLWRSTLFVTNFSKDTDDKGIRKLFSQYGTILQTRWPSLKYASSRRFCYVTMDSPASAQSALVLDHFKPDDGYPMSVKISDPAARQKRSDEANTKLFVGGLNPKTKEGHVRELFNKYGQIRSVKLGWDREKRECKGFAFVEMAKEAALELNGTPYHGHGLKVELSDPHFASKKANARLLVLQGVPEGTQEALLQQELAKTLPVVRVELFARRHEAHVELETAKAAGEFVLQRPPPPAKNPETSRNPAVAGTAGSAAPQSSLGFQPRIRKTAKALPKAYHVPKAVAPVEAEKPRTNQGQADFRAFMNKTNEARKAAVAASANAAAPSAAESSPSSRKKRESEPAEDEPSGKKPKTS